MKSKLEEIIYSKIEKPEIESVAHSLGQYLDEALIRSLNNNGSILDNAIYWTNYYYNSFEESKDKMKNKDKLEAIKLLVNTDSISEEGKLALIRGTLSLEEVAKVGEVHVSEKELHDYSGNNNKLTWVGQEPAKDKIRVRVGQI